MGLKKNGGLLATIYKGERVIIERDGSENSFILNALLILKSGTKSKEYQHRVNFDNYERWLKVKLIPNLPPDSVLVMNNAAYHNVQLNLAPTSSSQKIVTIDQLSDFGILLCDQICKPKLYSLIKLHKS
jgi:hypothetical protein